MFESVPFPQQFIRVDDGVCDIMVSYREDAECRFAPTSNVMANLVYGSCLHY